MKPELYVIAGPTACGKTQTAVRLARQLDGEVVSADSMLVYRGMDIGTAKPMTAEREGIPHHLIDIIDPGEPFSAAQYQLMAQAAIADIRQRGKIPILAGGTGFYINAVVYGNRFSPEDAGEMEYRRQLCLLADEKGVPYLHQLLREADPASAEAIHPNNVKRVARALSFYRHTGRRLSEHNENQYQNSPAYAARFVVLNWTRETLYRRINERVTRMMDAGLEEEVRSLLSKGYEYGLTSMQGIGYKETVRYIRGLCSWNELIQEIQLNTRHYAKRQVTWFRRQAPGALWLDAEGKPPEEWISEIISSPSQANSRPVPQRHV